ncbi:methyltransferase [Legionella birminghamensis]|uniref:Methyltransferase n=1 Tax=Legionella birminghamensis TaxID=28083 RepID=A0A378I6H5_9GAMM|nr:ergothioneine biosynthesis protein EgtB [Legionella birminghamensis]KTC72481.1 methyltransferase [Legionella birminghamensis]STX30613.1 methyltransferase [Legionella birminghamensis]
MNRAQLRNSYQTIRNQTETLCGPLVTEDFVIQAMEDVSPPKWHLAHTSWFFETFILQDFVTNYQRFHDDFHFLFNSYYQGVGSPFPRPKRGLLSRPTVNEVFGYRRAINHQMLEMIDNLSDEQIQRVTPLITLGLHHEQQHQELLLMDIKYNFSINPLFPIYKQAKNTPNPGGTSPLQFIGMPGAVAEIGHEDGGFCFDNERPRHSTILMPYALANRLVTNAEYLEFIEAQAYEEPQWWLADGWDWCQNQHIRCPLYWHRIDGQWHIFGLSGLKPLVPGEPVAHISFYEADAYARWRGCRLPTEAEWEHFASHCKFRPETDNFMDKGIYHPVPFFQQSKEHSYQLFGDLWEWTSSCYSAYPGYRSLEGSLGEYNGKFMNNQRVLRGGSCATPAAHIRTTYRNFFQADKRWVFSGIRLARDEENLSKRTNKRELK